VFARWALLVSVFLTFVSDLGAPYSEWFSPFSWAHFYIEALPWKVRPIDHVFLLCLLLAPKNRESREPAVKPMRKMLLLSAGTTVVWFLYGWLRGGDAWAASWQIYLMLSGVLCAFAIAANFRTPEHWVLFAKMLLAAAVYRATMCWGYYIFYIHPGLVYPVPEFLTSHDDTVLWVSCILLVLLAMIEPVGRPRRGRLWFLLFLMMGAVLWNQRRIAYVSLGIGGALLLGLLPAGKAKRRAMRAVYAMAPVVLIYAAVGWGRSEKIFKPLQSISTVTTSEDTSTKARNVENLGLIATSNANNMFMGTGWGHKYVEVSSKYSIALYFPLWQYIPHNSILGLLAFTGILGFAGYWMVFPTAMFLAARMARLSQSTLPRQIGALGAANLMVCANQFYGDMGIYYAKGVYMLSVSYAIALRLPIMAGAWPAPRGFRGRADSLPAVPAGAHPSGAPGTPPTGAPPRVVDVSPS
jgi:hypothetical protein